ncbi:hypothetical protein TNCV_2540861 [Trichonephila clavipes]|nr:hypothetical protein TNCV_2540861 [Trichonephila clavipes]
MASLSVSRFNNERLLVVGIFGKLAYLSGPSSLLELKDAIRREVSSIHPDVPHSYRCWICNSSECLPLWWWSCGVIKL